MSGQRDVYYLGATQIAMGALGSSVFPTRVMPPPYCVGGFIQRISGGSLEVLPSDLSGKTISGATAGGLGFLLGVSLIAYPFEGPAAFYLGATGATAVAGIMWKFSAGATLN